MGLATIRNGVGMIIEPRVRGFICTTAHPAGCAAKCPRADRLCSPPGAIAECPKRVAVLGCSTGYGLASRIVATFAGGADTIGVSMEREPSATKSGSAGWYNNRAFEIEAGRSDDLPLTLEGDAFSDELKKTFIERVREKFGQLDMLVYSMAAPVRTDPDTGKTYRSAIKPLGAPVEIKTLNTETGEVFETTIAPASEDEAAATVAVMGGDDWKRWIDQLADAGVLAPGFRTLNYTYIGSELTWPIYWKGTLGRAKVDLDRKAEEIRGRLGQDAARVVALKAVVTQASSAIPVVPLYGTVLFKVMKQLGLHEGCIEQIDRLFRTRLGQGAEVDEAQRLRVDDWELSPEVQAEVSRRWPLLSTETLGELADLAEYRSQFLRLFGFGIDGVDYAQDVDPARRAAEHHFRRLTRPGRYASPRRDLLGALERRARHAAVDIGVERRPRRHHLEQPHRKVQPRADHDVGGRKGVAEDPRALLQGGVEHVEDPLRIAPAGGDRIHLDLGGELHHRRLDAAGREEQPVADILRAADRRAAAPVWLPDSARRHRRRSRPLRASVGVAVLQRRHLAHRVDREIFRRLLRAGGNVGQHALIRLAGFFHQPERGERTRARRPIELHHLTSFLLLPPIIFHHKSGHRLDRFLFEHESLALVPAPGLLVLAHAAQPDFVRQMLCA